MVERDKEPDPGDGVQPSGSASPIPESQVVGADEQPPPAPHSCGDGYPQIPPDSPDRPRVELSRAEWIAVATCIAVVAQAFIYYLTLTEVQKTTQAVQAQASAAQKQFEITDRPWLSIDVVPAGPLLFSVDTPNLTVRYVIKNVGRSVATGVAVNAQIFIPEWENGEIFTEPTKRQKALCEKPPDSSMPFMVFPNEVKEPGASFTLRPREMNQRQIEKSTGMITPMLIGCVDYTFGGQSVHHQTGFIYQANMFGPNKDIAVPYGIRISQDVPADKLFFTKYGFGGDYAN